MTERALPFRVRCRPAAAPHKGLKPDLGEKEKETGDPRLAYCIASASSTELPIRRAHQAIREHWSIENENHYPRDAYYREDRCNDHKNHAIAIINCPPPRT